MDCMAACSIRLTQSRHKFFICCISHPVMWSFLYMPQRVISFDSHDFSFHISCSDVSSSSSSARTMQRCLLVFWNSSTIARQSEWGSVSWSFWLVVRCHGNIFLNFTLPFIDGKCCMWSSRIKKYGIRGCYW